MLLRSTPASSASRPTCEAVGGFAGMFACEKNGEDVLAWDAELSSLSSEDQRRAATARFRDRFQAEFLPWFAGEQRKQG